jgi:hypothetical protein
MAKILARLTKRQPSWTDDQIRDLFTRVTICLDVASGAAKIAKTSAKEPLPSALKSLLSRIKKNSATLSLGKVVAFLCLYDERAQTLLRSLLASIDSFYHPSNAGKWSPRLGAFLATITSNFVKTKELKAVTENGFDIVALALPLATRMLFTTGASQILAVSIVRDLAWLQPLPVYAEIRTRTDSALANVKSGLQLPACISALSICIPPLLKARADPLSDDDISQELVNFAEALVPAIDANDLTKTVSALRFFGTFFSHFPVGRSGQPHEIQTREISRALLERIVLFLRSQDAPGKAQNMMDRLVYRLISKVTMLLFGNSSSSGASSLFNFFLEKLKSTSASNFYRECGVIAQSAVRAFPECLSLLLRARLPDEVRVEVLSRAVRFAGPHLSESNMEELRAVLKTTLAFDGDDEAPSFNAGLRLLKNLLKSLTETYQLLQCYCRPEEAGNRIGDTLSSQPLSSRFLWFQPEMNHLQLAWSLIQSHALPALDHATLGTGKPARRKLKLVREIVKGGARILKFTEPSHVVVQTDHTDEESPLSPPLDLGTKLVASLADAHEFRSTAADFVSRLLSSMLSSGSSDLKTIKAVVKLGDVVLNRFGAPEQRTTFLSNRLQIFGAEMKEPRNSKGFQKYTSVVAIAEKVLLLHLRRTTRQRPFFSATSHPASVEATIKSMCKVSELNADYFGDTRTSIAASLRNRSWLQYDVLRAFSDVTKSLDSTEESIKAACLFLKSHWSLHRFLRNPLQVEKFVQVALTLTSLNFPKIQSTLMSVVGAFDVLFFLLQFVANYVLQANLLVSSLRSRCLPPNIAKLFPR